MHGGEQRIRHGGVWEAGKRVGVARVGPARACSRRFRGRCSRHRRPDTGVHLNVRALVLLILISSYSHRCYPILDLTSCSTTDLEWRGLGLDVHLCSKVQSMT